MSALRTDIVFRRVLGFGPWGWALLPVAVGLGACVLSGVDLRHKLIAAINAIAGVQGMYTSVTRILPGQSLAILDPIPSPVTLLWLLPALFLQPRRVPWWAWVVAVMVCALFPNALWEVYMRILRSSSSTTGTNVAQAVAWFATCIWLPCLCAWVTGSRWCTVVVVVPALALAVASLQRTGFPNSLIPAPITWFAMYPGPATYHIIAASILIGGAIASRRSVAALRPYMCRACGYDRRGLKDADVCPECGSPKAHAPTGAPAARSV